MKDIHNIVILTGAGISAESGIPVFRSETGLWEEHRVEDVATYEGFLRDRTLVHNFYNGMRRKLSSVKPNEAHKALTRLQNEWKNGKVSIITQNIDNLHEAAGSIDVIHMHGELMKVSCEKCHRVFDWDRDSSVDTVCPSCGRKAIRPHIVWFGETPYDMDMIYALLSEVDLFISIGTSGVVYPAAGFARLAKGRGAFNIEFNLEQSATAGYFDTGIYGKAGTTLPEFVDALIRHGDLSFLNESK